MAERFAILWGRAARAAEIELARLSGEADADLVLFDPALRVTHTIVGGKLASAIEPATAIPLRTEPVVAVPVTEARNPATTAIDRLPTIEMLRQALTAAASKMPEPKKLFPKKWLEIKQWLEGMSEPYLEYSNYARHCTELHEKDPEQQAALAAAMDELGVALNYARDPRLRDPEQGDFRPTDGSPATAIGAHAYVEP